MLLLVGFLINKKATKKKIPMELMLLLKDTFSTSNLVNWKKLGIVPSACEAYAHFPHFADYILSSLPYPPPTCY